MWFGCRSTGSLTSPPLSRQSSFTTGHPFSPACGDGGTEGVVVGWNTEQGLSEHFAFLGGRELFCDPRGALQ